VRDAETAASKGVGFVQFNVRRQADDGIVVF